MHTDKMIMDSFFSEGMPRCIRGELNDDCPYVAWTADYIHWCEKAGESKEFADERATSYCKASIQCAWAIERPKATQNTIPIPDGMTTEEAVDTLKSDTVRLIKSTGIPLKEAVRYLEHGREMVKELDNHCQECMAKLKGHNDQEYNCMICPTRNILTAMEGK